MTDVAFVCAMPMEARPLARRLGLSRSSVAGSPGYRGRVGPRGAVVVVTGMGPRLATAATQRLLAAVTPARVIVVGIAGALVERVPLGTVIVPEVVVDGDTGDEYRPAAMGGTEARGTLWTSGSLITGPEALAHLDGQGVIALDMETAAVAAVCEAYGTPWSVVRVISDHGADEQVLRLNHPDGTPDLRAVARFVVAHPGRVPALARLGRDANRAARRAAEVASTAAVG